MNDILKYITMVLLSSISLFGCSGMSYRDSAPQERKLKPLEEIRIDINASGSWRSTGVVVEKGNKYKITATGRWRRSGMPWDPWIGPDGVGGSSIFTVVGGYTGETLIARIGQNPPFAVGGSFLLDPGSEGLLYFRINDVTPSNAKGVINVSVTNSTPDRKVGELTPMASQMDLRSSRYKSLDIKNSWAVIIGISTYKYSGQKGLDNLIFADDDAKAFKRSLITLGWSQSHIKILVNEEATQRNVMIALESWLTKAGPDDQIVLFWAGHGFPDPEDPEKVYFACYDTDIKIPATGYRMDKVRTALEERKAKNVVVLADTCHAGKLITRGDRGLSIVPNIEKMSREQKVPNGWIFMVGADTDRQAIEHTSWTNGAFTHSLIKGLSGKADGFQSAGAKDGIVTMGELRSYMNTTMPDETQKVLGVAKRPVITTSTGDPDIWNLTLQAQ